MKQTNPIQHETVPLKTLCRAPKGTTAIYVGAIPDANRINGRIQSYAAHTGCKLQTQRFVGVNTRTGQTIISILAKVVERGTAKRKPGPKLGSKNRVKA